MGAWSSSILGNDTSCEVRERFFELYDLGKNASDIAAIVLHEQRETLQYDRTNIWLGLALATWECKVLTQEIFDEVKKIVNTKEDIEFNRELDADDQFLKERQVALETLIKKLSIERNKPRARKRIPKKVQTIYKSGMCLTYKNQDNYNIGIFITNSEHFRNKGKIEFFFMDFESNTLPTLEMYANSKLYGLKKLGEKWGHYEYLGNVTDLHYEKNNKEEFFINVPKSLKLIGQIKAPNKNKLINNFKGDFLYLNNPKKMIESMEKIRFLHKEQFSLSQLRLSELLEIVANEE